VDAFANTGFLLGAGALALPSAARLGAALVHRVAGGAALGTGAGVLAHVATKAREEGVVAVKEEVGASLPAKAAKELVEGY
jgi:hypothetical protein